MHKVEHQTIATKNGINNNKIYIILWYFQNKKFNFVHLTLLLRILEESEKKKDNTGLKL